MRNTILDLINRLKNGRSTASLDNPIRFYIGDGKTPYVVDIIVIDTNGITNVVLKKDK